MVSALTDGERAILDELNREAEEGLCPVCGEFYPASEYTQEWRVLLPEEFLETETEALIPLVRCCPDCVDGYFSDDTCAHRMADGSRELC